MTEQFCWILSMEYVVVDLILPLECHFSCGLARHGENQNMENRIRSSSTEALRYVPNHFAFDLAVHRHSNQLILLQLTCHR